MPRIIELRKEGDDLWAKIPSSVLEDGPIMLLSVHELSELKQTAYTECANAIVALSRKERGVE